MSDLILGRNGKQGSVDTNNIKAGIKKEQIKDNAKLQTIFDSIDGCVDGKKDGIIDADEMAQFKQKLMESAGNDETLSTREAGKFLKKEGIKNIDKKELFEILQQLSQSGDNIKESTIEEKNGQKFIKIKYNDGSEETINPDKSSQIVSNLGEGKTKTEKRDQKGNITEETVETEDGRKAVTSFKDGKASKTVITDKNKPGVTQTVTYDAEEKPARLKVENGTTEENYTYVDDKPQLTSKTENKGLPAKEVKTDYTYNDDGTITAVSTETASGKKTTAVTKNDTVISQITEEPVQGGGIRRTESKPTENGREETVTEGENNITKTIYNKENKALTQTKTVNGQEYNVEYDGKGNTKIILQNGESIEALAKKFGCSKQELLDANGGKIRGWAGDDLVVPGELKADDTRLQGRQTKEEAVAAYKVVAEEIQQVKDEAAARKPISFTNKDYDTYEEMAKALFKREGNESPSTRQMKARIEDLKKTNPDIKDGELKGKRITANVAQEMQSRISGKEQTAKEYKQNLETRKNAEGIAKKFYQIADENAGQASMRKMQALFDSKEINKDNIVAVLDAYDKEKHGDSSIIDTVTSETGAGGTKQQKDVLRAIIGTLCDAAKDAGVSDEDIEHAKTEFETSMDNELAAFRRTNPKDMEKAVDFLRGAIVAKKTGNVQEMSDEDAIATFNSDFASTDADAQKQYADARKEEGWTAKVGDTVCGWFGCTTIDDMDKKLGKNAADVKKLAAAGGNEAEFKKIYKEVFGVEFDKNKIAARDAALGNLQQAQNMSSTINITSGILKKSGSLDYSGLRNEIKTKFQFDDNTIDSVIQSYANTIGKEASTDDAKKQMLTRFLEETQNNAVDEYRNLTKGKTIEQMNNDLDLLTKSAFGTNDIVKDVIQFNENQQTTEMVTDAAFEIAGTIALQAVPGLGQMAAARLAVSAAKWGTKAVKVVNYAAKAEKAFAAAKKFQNLNRATRIGTQMANAGVATATVEASSGKDAKTVMRKTLMNMSFAGVGAGSSVLAPKLMQSFGITNRALANEIAEEIINAAGSYGVTKVAGDDYGSQDAFIDFATGIIMSRISHVKKSSSDISTPKPADPVTPKPVDPIIPKPADPVTPRPVDPVTPKPVEPVTPKPIEPVNPKPVEPVNPKPVKPKPVEPAPVHPTPDPTPAPKPKPADEAIKQRTIAKQQAGIVKIDKPINPQQIQKHSGCQDIHRDGRFIEVSSDTKLVVGSDNVVDFNNLPPEIQKKIDLLDDGEVLKIGRDDINPNDNLISREHLQVTKQNGKIVITDISSNGTKVFDKANLDAYNSINHIKQNNNVLNQNKYLSSEKEFLKNTGNDYVLLNKLLSSNKLNINNERVLNNIIGSTNSNNKAILEEFVNNPSGIKKKSSFDGSSSISDSELGMLMLFNRNHPSAANIISSPIKVREFLDNTQQTLGKINKTSPEIVSLIETGNYKGIKGEASVNALNDIEMLAHGEDYIKHYKKTDSLVDIARNTPEGDVVSLNGRMFVNDNGRMVQLNLSEDRFKQLFPPVNRFTTHQGQIGTCYLVSTLDNLMSLPKGRAKIYQMIGEDSNGIYTMTANGKGQKDYFKRFPRHSKHMYDQNGLAIIEQGYCKNAKDNAMRKFDASETIIMDIGEGGFGYQAMEGLLGVKTNVIWYDQEKMKDFIVNMANNPDFSICAGTRHVDGKTDSHILNGKYDIHAGHEYSIKGYNKENNTVLISNPWHSGSVIEVPMDEFLKQFNEIGFAKLS